MHRRRVLLVAALVAQIELVTAVVALTVVALLVSLLAAVSLQLPPGIRSVFVQSLGVLFAAPFLVFVFQVIRALQRPHPTGLRADSRMSRDLMATINRTARHIGLQGPDSVLISAGFETVVIANRPRGYRLVIGLPILDVLDGDEFAARIAVGLHRSFGGDPITARAYRMAMRLAALFESPPATLSAPRGVALRIAVACMNALDLPAVLAEREAHARGDVERSVGIAKLERALLRPAIYEEYARNAFWPGLIARHSANLEPPDVMTQLRAFCRAPLPTVDGQRVLNLAASALALDNPHADALPVPAQPASDVLLRDTASVVTAAFDTVFRSSFGRQWGDLRQRTTAIDAELARIERSAENSVLEPESAWRRIELVEERRGAPDALPLYRDWIATHPGDGRALFKLGRCALAERADDAIAILESAIAVDESYAVDANLMIAAELTARGELAQAEMYRDRHEAALKVQQAALNERGKWGRDESLRPHGLADHEVGTVIARLRAFPDISSATLAARKVDHLANLPCIVIGVRFREIWFWFNAEKIRAMLSQIAEVPLPMQFLVVNLNAGGQAAKTMSRAPAVQIYRAERVPSRVRLARWGRVAQLILVASGVFLIVTVGVINRDCSPG